MIAGEGRGKTPLLIPGNGTGTPFGVSTDKSIWDYLALGWLEDGRPKGILTPGQLLLWAPLLLIFTCGSAAVQNPDYPLVHKDASEVTIRFTQVVMNGGTDLLSTSAFRYGLVLTDPFGRGRLRGTLEYTLDWLPAIVLTKPKVVYGAGVAPIGFRWNFLGNWPTTSRTLHVRRFHMTTITWRSSGPRSGPE